MFNFVRRKLNNMKKYISITLLCCLSFTVFAQISQKNNIQNTESIFSKTGVVYFSFEVPDKTVINNILTRIISIDKINKKADGTWKVFAYANRKEFSTFLEKGYAYTLLPKPSSLFKGTKMLSREELLLKGVKAWDSYPTYAAYETMMHNFRMTYPSLCKIDTIMSVTPKGTHKILAAHISNTHSIPSNKPQFLYSSSMHGDELTGYVLMLRLIDYLLSGYGTNQRATNIVNNVDLWICPLANPDGTFLNSETVVTTAQRENYNNIDLNRNYPDPRDGQHPDGNAWQPETQAFMNFASQHHFNMAANFHGGAELMNFPWDTWTTPQNTHADDNWWRYVSRQFVDSVHINAGSLGSSYFTDEDNGITEGGDWYVITGGRQDYMNYFHRCREVTLEISSTKTPSASSLPSYWTALSPSLLKYIEQSLNGVRGLVTDSLTGQAVRAKVFITGHDRDSSHVYAALPVGNYHRYLYSGTYDLTFSATCYRTKTIRNVSVINGLPTLLDVQLTPGLTIDFTVDTSNASCSGEVQFRDITGNATSWLWDFGDGSTSTLQNPSHLYSSNGLYTVKLKASTSCGTDSVVKVNFLNVSFLPQTTDGSHCGPGQDTLRVAGNGNFIWYASPAPAYPLDTGNVFITPFINNTTTYYVQNRVEFPVQNVGNLNNNSNGSFSTANRYLIFDCYHEGRLISVQVNAELAIPSLSVQLEDHNGNLIDSTILTNVPAGISRINLNLNLPRDTSLRLHWIRSSGRLYRNQSGTNYPYEIPGFIKIKTSDAGDSYYYYFYDWRVQMNSCIGPVMAVQAFINALPDADFDFNVNSNSVTFTNNSIDANAWLWDFGDGYTSTDENPVHVYADSGYYNVKLTVFNSCAEDSVLQSIHISSVPNSVNDTELGAVIYPNPAGDVLNIRVLKANGKELMVIVSDLGGKQVMKKILNTTGNNYHLAVNGLDQGMYFIKIDNGKTFSVLKFVKR